MHGSSVESAKGRFFRSYNVRWASWAMHVKIHLIHAARAAKCVLKEPSSLKTTTNEQEEMAAISVPI